MKSRSRHYGRVVVLVSIMTSFLIGLGLARWGYDSSINFVLLLAITAVLFRKQRFIRLMLLSLIFCSLGVIRGASMQSQLIQYDSVVDTKVTVVGRIETDPKYGFRGQTDFLLTDVEIDSVGSLPGSVRVRTFNGIGLQRGDIVAATAKLRDGFGNYQGSLSYATVEPIARSSSPVEKIRREYFAGVYSSIPEPQASLGLGFLVGLRALLPDSLLDQLSATGLTHIVAVSGYNLTVIIRLTKRWFLRYSRYTALMMSFGLMILFLLVTGGAASIVRASVVATTALLGWYFGREIKPIVLLLFSAVVTAGWNPLFLWFDLGWWLSFLAFFGVLIVAPTLRRVIRREKLGLFAQTLLETTSAQLMALPLIVAIFGEVSVISLVANLVILPLIPIAMLLTFVAGSAGVFVPALAGWIAWPAVRLLSFMTNVIQLLAATPGAVGQVQIHQSSMYVFYGCTCVVLLIAWRKREINSMDLL